MSLMCDIDASVDFLRKWAMNGPWALTAIDTSRRGVSGKVFQPNQEEALREFLQQCFDKNQNVYFHVNRVSSDVINKAKREDITHVTHFHVDIDPRAGEPLDEERARIRELIANPPTGVPKPTWVVFSGGGYQLFWELLEPIEVNGSLSEAEHAKLYNLQLEILFDADNCHNIDRIMRLPGTINVPDAKKIAKGRTRQLAKVVEYNDSSIWQVSDFMAANLVQSPDTGFASSVDVDISGNLERAGSADVIREWVTANNGTISDWLLILIVQGMDPEKPNRFESRSDALHAACCGMHRSNLTPLQIYAIITDQDWDISASVLDKGGSVEKYAKRQIERAIEACIDPNLLYLNEKHAVIECHGGKCVVIQEIYDPHMKRNNLVKQSFTDFSNRYRNKKVSIGMVKDEEKFVPLGKWWLDHEKRRSYETIVFAPGREVSGSYNLWQGFHCEAKPGDCSLFLAHIHKNICGGVDEYFSYLMGWMARCVQKPGSPGEACVVLRGRQGTGKTLFVTMFGRLFGRHFMTISDPKHMVGSFNQHLKDCIVLFGDEAFFAGDKKHEGALKTLITGEYLTVEAKGYDAESSPNFIHLLMASNSDWVIPAGAEERRFFVLDVKEHHMQDNVYFKKISDQMSSGGNEALLHTLMTYKLDSFNHRKIPQTEALQEQKERSMSEGHEWWFNKLMAGELLRKTGSWEGKVTVDELYADYVEYMDMLRVYRKHTKTTLGRMISKMCPGASPHRKSETIRDVEGSARYRSVYTFPELNICRDYWDHRFFKGDWGEVADLVTGKIKGEPF